MTRNGRAVPTIVYEIKTFVVALLAATAAAFFLFSGPGTPDSADDRPGQFRYDRQRGDATKGEATRVVITYVPTGEVAAVDTVYTDGRLVQKNFRYDSGPKLSGTLFTEKEFLPHPSNKTKVYLKREAHFSGDGQRKLSEDRYRPDGTREETDLYTHHGPQPGFIRTTYAKDGKTVVSRHPYDLDGNPIYRTQ